MLKIKNLQKQYSDFALNCSLNVDSGRIVGLIGQNGSGKSTIFKAILQLITKDSGEIELFGHSVEHLTVKDKERLGIVLTETGFGDYLTISNLLPILTQLYPTFDDTSFLEYVQTYHLPLNKPLKEFSTGMRAKLHLLVALTHQAELLLLDEPTAGLDVVAREELLSLLQDYMDQDLNRSILISSHISSDLEQLCDDFYFIHDGEIILQEDSNTLLEDYGLLKLTEQQYEELDKSYILCVQKEKYSFRCLTNKRQYYTEDMPAVIVEKAGIDEILPLLIRGERL